VPGSSGNLADHKRASRQKQIHPPQQKKNHKKPQNHKKEHKNTQSPPVPPHPRFCASWVFFFFGPVPSRYWKSARPPRRYDKTNPGFGYRLWLRHSVLIARLVVSARQSASGGRRFMPARFRTSRTARCMDALSRIAPVRHCDKTLPALWLSRSMWPDVPAACGGPRSNLS